MDIINSNNILLITTTIADQTCKKSIRRNKNILKHMNIYKINVYFNIGVKNICKNDLMYNNLKNMFEFFKNSKIDNTYGIICDNDFEPHENFMEELNTTVKLLPTDWRSLHLCPGFLWNRQKRLKTKGYLSPEGYIKDLSFDISGRFFINCGNGDFFKKQIWLGGPIAILVNKNTIDNLLNNYINFYNTNSSQPNDVILTSILNNNDYVCRFPLLGYENEQGGSCF